MNKYFTEIRIIKYLVGIRCKKALNLHKEHFLGNISSYHKCNHDESLYKYFPPRRLWVRPRLAERMWKPGYEVNKISLLRTILRYYYKQEYQDEKWVLNLKYLIAEIRLKALTTSTIKFGLPKLTPIPKKKGSNIYRPIVQYNLVDRVIYGLCAKYIRDLFDPFLSPYCFSFRAPNANGVITHHDAFNKIMEFRAKNDGKDIYVAECDIKGFYDTVNHKLALDVFNKLVKKNKDIGINIHDQCLRIFNEYIKSYNYNEFVMKESSDWFKVKGINGQIPDLNDFVKRFYDGDVEPYGVAQGGAISCIIANIVLSSADENIMNYIDEDSEYIRYCDDMILLSTSKEKIDTLFSIYLRSLEELKLPYHPPVVVTSYPKNSDSSLIWDIKSKNPYIWNKDFVPWIGFVGYQLRYDALVRIRKGSIKKEIEKQIEETNKVLKLLHKKRFIYRNKRQIVHRLHQRLLSMSIGRRPLNIFDDFKKGFCWGEGFKALKTNDYVTSGLKLLDRTREIQISRLIRKLSLMSDLDFKAIKKNHQKINKYWGKPYSYYNYFNEVNAEQSLQPNSGPQGPVAG